MSFSVSLDFKGEQFPAVDPLAIQWSAQGSYVWKYADGKVSKVMAQIIERNNDGVLVNGPLKPGDQVVTQGIEQLSENMGVRALGANGVALEDNGAQSGGNKARAGAGATQGNAGQGKGGAGHAQPGAPAPAAQS
jgi:hypothetical protein